MFTKSVLAAEVGLDLDQLSTSGPPRRAAKFVPFDAAVQTTIPAVVVENGFVDRELSRRAKILELEEKELRLRESALQREREKLEEGRAKLEKWREEETRRMRTEMEQARNNMASELEQEREALITERLKLTTELDRIQKLFP
jgi:hypothetical protein